MYRLRAALLGGLLLVVTACAASVVPNPPKVRLTDDQLEETTASSRPEDELPPRDQSIRSVKKSILDTENTQIQEPRLPAGSSLPAQGAYPFFPR
jgi:hypothetical protein